MFVFVFVTVVVGYGVIRVVIEVKLTTVENVLVLYVSHHSSVTVSWTMKQQTGVTVLPGAAGVGVVKFEYVDGA